MLCPVFRRALLARARLLSHTCLLSSAAVIHLMQPALADDTDQPKIEEIIVTATPYNSDPNKIATIVGQVNRSEILRNGGANLADALTNIPGVTGSSFAAGASRPIIRGFDANRVKILENGIGSFDVSDVGPDHGVPIDPLSTQEIEVVRGAATLRYGSQAIGGVVNAIDNRIPFAASDKPLSGEFTGTFGTAANLIQGSALVDARAGNFAFHADGFGRHTGDYDIPGGKQSNSFFRGDGFAFGSAYLGDQAKTGAAIIHYDAKYGIPVGTTFIDMKQTKGLVRSSIDLNGSAFGKLNIDAGYADYSHSEKEKTGVTLSTFKDKEWDSRAEALLAPNEVFSAAALGVQAQQRRFTALGAGADYLLPTKTTTGAAFAFAEAPLARILNLQLGARVEHVDASGTPISNVAAKRSFTPLSGSAGLVLTPADAVTLGLTLSSAARAPGQTELFARGPHDGPQTFEIGDPNLRIERSNSLEATMRINLERVVFEGAAWAAHFDNYIYGRLTGRTCDENGVCIKGSGNDLRELITQQHTGRYRGLEGKATTNLVETRAGILSLNVLADVVRATLPGLGNVPRIPPYHLGAGLNWSSAKFDAGFQWRYSGAQNNISAGETPTLGFSSLDARIGFKPWGKDRDVELSLVGRNLADTTQRNAVALNKDDVTLPGRDVRVVLRTAF